MRTKTTRGGTAENYGYTRRAIRATLCGKPATLVCISYLGTTPAGRRYATAPRWQIEFDGSCRAIGLLEADEVRALASK
jgi:hypothetical protein